MERKSCTLTEIYERLWTERATRVALLIGLSDVALGKWCKQYGVPKLLPASKLRVQKGSASFSKEGF
jgi:hypothetical protein